MSPTDDATVIAHIHKQLNALMFDRYYILDGHTPVPCHDFVTWATWHATARVHVAEDRGEGWWLSTVFLGQSLSLQDDPPLLFETALFVHHRLTDVLQRYATWEEAKHGHVVFLGKVPYLLANVE